MSGGSNPAGQRQAHGSPSTGNGGNGGAGMNGSGNGGSPSERAPLAFTSAAYYSGGNGGAGGVEQSPRSSLTRSSSFGKMGSARGKSTGRGKGTRHGAAVVAALMKRRRVALLLLIIGILLYTYSGHWLPTRPARGGNDSSAQKGTSFKPPMVPVSKSGESNNTSDQPPNEVLEGVLAMTTKTGANSKTPPESPRIQDLKASLDPPGRVERPSDHDSKVGVLSGIRKGGGDSGGIIVAGADPEVSVADTRDVSDAQWKGPEGIEPPISSMQRFRSRGAGNSGRKTFFELHNVRLQNRTVWLYTDPATARKVKPFKVALSHLGADFSVTVRHLPWGLGQPSPMASCTHHYKSPVVLFYAPPRGNLLHYLLDGALALFPTLDARHLLDNFPVLQQNMTDTDQYLGIDKCTFRKDASSNEAMAITWGRNPYKSAVKWSPLLKHMLKRQLLMGRDLQDDNVLCIDRLLLGRSQALDWTAPDATKGARQRALKRFLWFAKHSAAHDHSEQVHAREMAAKVAANPAAEVLPQANCHKALPSFLAGKPVVLLASRANASSRAVRNEVDLLAYVDAHYDVVIEVITDFNASGWQTLNLLQRTDVFVGMHSDAWTHAMFLRDEAAAVQLLPYGWEFAPGSKKPLIRGNYYQAVVEATGAAYFSWVNPLRENAIFRKEDFAGTPGTQFVLHPTSDMALPTSKSSTQAEYWLSQETKLDMASLGPVLDQAFAAAGILQRPEPALQDSKLR